MFLFLFSKWHGRVLSSADLNEILQKSTAKCIWALFCFHKQPNHVDQTGDDDDDDNDDGDKHIVDDDNDKDDINYGKKNTYRLNFIFTNRLIKIMVMNMMMLTTKIITIKVTRMMDFGFNFEF